MVSGTFNSPYRGTFHLSLALLIAIGRNGVLSLGGWAPLLHAEFHGIHVTLVRLRVFAMSHTGLSPCIVCLSRHFCYCSNSTLAAHNPGSKLPVWADPLRSPLLTESRLISFPVDTEMFQFSTLAPCTLYIQMQVI